MQIASTPWPYFVFTSITPLAPREPYCAVSAAFFKMVMLSMSADPVEIIVCDRLSGSSVGSIWSAFCAGSNSEDCNNLLSAIFVVFLQ